MYFAYLLSTETMHILHIAYVADCFEFLQHW